MKTEKEILEVLKMIQDFCEKNECNTCLLRNGFNCCGLLVDSNNEKYISPIEWLLREYDNPRLILN